MIEMLPSKVDGVVEIKFSGKLHDEDYKSFVPAFDKAFDALDEGKKLRVIGMFDDFHGWDLHSAWDDAQFGATRSSKMERMAVVGDKSWEEHMIKVAGAILGPIVHVKFSYFDTSETDAAWEWVQA